MRFAAALSDKKDPAQAVEEAADRVLQDLDGQPAHLAILFVSSLYRTDWVGPLGALLRKLGSPVLLGCTGGGILAQGRELEWVPAVSLAAGFLPNAKIHPFRVSPADLEEARSAGFWIEKSGASPTQEPVGILLPEPFSCDCLALVQALNAAYPKIPIIGGLASGAKQAGENALFFNDEVLGEGAVGALLTGDVTLQTIVSQGCKPIGRPFIVTKAEENVILELAGAPATEALRQLYEKLPDADKALAQRALLLGIVMDEYRESFRRGDFLMRNLIGMDPSTGAIAVGDRTQVGQTVQFHVRDADTSREDLQTLLTEQSRALSQSPPAGALLFSCLGRGQELYGEPDYDTRAIQKAIGPCPIAGFFCNGEIGPIGSRNYLHGFTSSLGLFRPRNSS
jgi:small ligand-binding sensory domain FIST